MGDGCSTSQVNSQALSCSFTSSGKRVAGIASKTTLHAINQPHRYLFLDGTCLKDVTVSVRENLHSIFCLAFLPEDGVVPCWAELKPILSLNPSLLPVLDYVESTWVLNDIYPIPMWNVCKAVIDGGLRTNKFLERHKAVIDGGLRTNKFLERHKAVIDGGLRTNKFLEWHKAVIDGGLRTNKFLERHNHAL